MNGAGLIFGAAAALALACTPARADPLSRMFDGAVKGFQPPAGTIHTYIFRGLPFGGQGNPTAIPKTRISKAELAGGRCLHCNAPVDRPEASLVAMIRFVGADGREELCSGTFVSADKVLTAGHCGCGAPASYRVEVVDGRTYASKGAFRLRTAPAFYDPTTCVSGITPGNDLALLAIDSELKCQPPARRPSRRLTSRSVHTNPAGSTTGCSQFSPIDTILGAPAPSVWDLRNEFAKGASRVLIAGYGQSEFEPRGGFLRAGIIPALSAGCAGAASIAACEPFAEMALADAMRRDTCPGDSGGPVFAYSGLRAVLIGVTSRAAFIGPDEAGLPCGGGGIYTLLGRKSVFDWLRANKVGVSALGAAASRVAQDRRQRAHIAGRTAGKPAVAQNFLPFGSLTRVSPGQ